MGDFLGTGATFGADLNLVLQVAMGLSLLGGMFLARAKHFTAHKYVQSSVVVGNLFLIGFIMVPSFSRQVEPYIPGHLSTPYYWVASVHAVAGIITEALAIYVVLVAGTGLLPQRFRFRNYKLWMRTVLILWWTVLGLGIGLYSVWYLQPAAKVNTTPGSHGSHAFTILISNYRFSPQIAMIAPGTTVTWIDTQGTHGVNSLSKAKFVSPVLSPAGRFTFRFVKPGVYPYDCLVHGSAMPGRIEVRRG